MRHAASLLAAMEGINRPAFRIARELANNSRSGLTTRFLAKKLDIPEEEVEYLVDINHRFLFTDLTKIKIAPEGANAVRRILRGLENHGDIPSLFRAVKALSTHEFRDIEDTVGQELPFGKRAAAEELIRRHYLHPDSVVTYVATREFSTTARELFDIVWQSQEGIMPVATLRALHNGPEYEVEQGLRELFDAFALFELFRFDAEDRLVRAAALLSELRQWREKAYEDQRRPARLKPIKGAVDVSEERGLSLSDRVCRLVAAIAARPARLRSDSDLFREDRKRLEEVCPDGTEPSLNTCLWFAQAVGWLARVDSELRAGDIENLLRTSRVTRQKILADWLLSGERSECPRRLLAAMCEEMKPGKWYSVVDVVRLAVSMRSEDEQPVLRSAGGHWAYMSPSAMAHSERAVARAFDETLPWLGMVDRAEGAGESYCRLTDIGRSFLTGEDLEALEGLFPPRKAEIVVQPNFDIVVPTEDMDPLLTVPLDQFATRTSTGKATVYTLSKDSFTRAVQDGHDGGAFVAFLLAHNRGGELPRNVLTTLEDWRGGIKHVRIRTLHVIESSDPLVMADLLHRRRLKKYFETIEPQKTAAFVKISKKALAKELEKDGFVVE